MTKKLSKKIDFNNKVFKLVQNSDHGSASDQTKFIYKQDGNLVTADYYGGEVRYGKIIAELKNEKLHMIYQCMTTTNELKTGKALADITLDDKGKIKLKLNWEWLTSQEKGVSEYIEE